MRSLLTLALALLAGCGGASTQATPASLAGHWVQVSLAGQPLPRFAFYFCANTCFTGATLTSATIDVDAANGYAMVQNYATQPSPDRDLGTLRPVGDSLIFDSGLFGPIKGRIANDTLHEYYKGFDYAFVRK